LKGLDRRVSALDRQSQDTNLPTINVPLAVGGIALKIRVLGVVQHTNGYEVTHAVDI
jgi:hypothetical protein